MSAFGKDLSTCTRYIGIVTQTATVQITAVAAVTGPL